MPDAPRDFAYDAALDDALRENYSGAASAPASLQLDVAGIGAALRRLPLAERLGLDAEALYGLSDAAAPPRAGGPAVGTRAGRRAAAAAAEHDAQADAELDALLAGVDLGVDTKRAAAVKKEEEEEEEDLEDFLASVL